MLCRDAIKAFKKLGCKQKIALKIYIGMNGGI